ncbi:MAG: signal peptide peptidase SppA [Candidatus Dasytiphilus stammeri]
MYKILQWIFKISRGIWNLLNFIRQGIFNILIIFIILLITNNLLLDGTSIFSKNRPRALLLDINGIIVDTPPRPSGNHQFNKFINLLSGKNPQSQNSLFNIVQIIRQAKDDKNITGMILDLENFLGTNQVSLHYIGKALQEFRNSGKLIYSIADNYSQQQYYLASYANRIYLSPKGEVDLKGIAINNLYYKKFLDYLQINSHIFRVGKYKAAVEPLMRNNMSQFSRQADTRWIRQLWQDYLITISHNRHIKFPHNFPVADDVVLKFQKVSGDTASYAYETKLVDEIISRSNFLQKMIQIFGYKNNSYNHVSFYDYQLNRHSLIKNKNKIAIIVMNGIITEKDQSRGSINSIDAIDQINNAANDSDIKAIVLYINSPGGSVTASDMIRQELVEARNLGKPIVVFMGGVAASGGYMISTPSNYIIASPYTLTGSIGVFGMMFTFEKTLAKIGIYTDSIEISPLSNTTNTKDIPSEAQKLMQINIQHEYNNFIDLVAHARQSTPEKIDKIAQGRVWSGQDAKKLGLIDKLGDFDDAVFQAAKLAKLKKWQLAWIQNDSSIFEQLVSSIRISVKLMINHILYTWLPVNQDFIGILKRKFIFNDPKNIYAQCLICSEIK